MGVCGKTLLIDLVVEDKKLEGQFLSDFKRSPTKYVTVNPSNGQPLRHKVP